MKWIKYAGTDDPRTGSCAPNLLIELINMFFLKDSATTVDESTGKENFDPCIRLYPGQVRLLYDYNWLNQYVYQSSISFISIGCDSKIIYYCISSLYTSYVVCKTNNST